jgi:DNA-binding Lrp family transcriptional regulator
MTESQALDKLDKAILRCLQHNGREMGRDNDLGRSNDKHDGRW